MAECLALHGVVDRPVDHRLGHRGGADGLGQALLRQLGHHQGETLALAAEHGAGRDPQVLEEQFGRVLGLHAELVEILAPHETGQAGIHQEQGDALGAMRGVGLGRQHHHVAQLAVGDEHLLAVDDVVAAVAGGAGADVLQVGAGVRLGHAERADGLAGDHFRQPVLLLLFGAERLDVGGDEVAMDQEAGTGEAAARQFLEHHHVEQVVQAEAAVLFRDGATEHAGFAGLEPQLPRNDARLLPLLVERGNLSFDELTYRGAEHFMFLTE